MYEDPVGISFLSHKEQRKALANFLELEAVSWTVKQEQYLYYEWALGYSMPALSYKITGSSPT